jgi:hypothetical protein
VCIRCAVKFLLEPLPTFPTRRPGFEPRSSHVGSVVDKVADFLRVLRFPLPILIPPTAPHSLSSIIRGWYSRSISDRLTKWTQPHTTPRKTKPLPSKNKGYTYGHAVWWDGFVKHAVEMDLSAMMYIPRSIKDGSRIQKLMGRGYTDKEHGNLISILLFFETRKSR